MTRSRRPFPDLPTELPPNLRFVLDLSPSMMTLGLGNIQALVERLDHPERRFQSIVVAGTNGKGSVTAMLASILHASGKRVGRFISPHVYSVTERVCVDDEPVALDVMEAAAARIVPLHEEIGFSYFEAITAIAFLVFAERDVHVAVLETGLGGRFDATNIVEPVATIITSIALDHRRVLGDTLPEILMEKLGITRSGVPLFTGGMPEDLDERIAERAAHAGFPVTKLDEIGSARVVDEGALDAPVVRVETRRRRYGEVRLPFVGRHQPDNLLLALGAAETVSDPVADLGGALARVYLPGRFEVVRAGERTVIMDVAHNDAALSGCLDVVTRAAPRDRTAVVLGLMRRKELFEFPEKALRAARRIYLIRLDGDALAPAELLELYFSKHLQSAATDVILWNQTNDTDDHWARLADVILEREQTLTTTLVTGSHHAVECFGRQLGKRLNG